MRVYAMITLYFVHLFTKMLLPKSIHYGTMVEYLRFVDVHHAAKQCITITQTLKRHFCHVNVQAVSADVSILAAKQQIFLFLIRNMDGRLTINNNHVI